MLRTAGVLLAVVLGLSATHTKGTVGEGQRVLRGAHLRVCFAFYSWFVATEAVCGCREMTI